MRNDDFRQLFEAEFTWISGFERNVRRYGKKRALTDPERKKTWSYEELDADASRLASALAGNGVSAGSVVAFVLRNSPEFVFCYIAAQKLGAVACPVNYNLSPAEIASILDDSEPAAYIYDTESRCACEMALELAKKRPGVILEAGNEFSLFMSSENRSYPIPERNIYDETVRLYTSGTTGRPKGVPLCGINEVLSAHDVMMHFPLNCTDVTMNMTPWFHRGGLHSGGPTPTLYAGGEVVVLRQFSPLTCLNAVGQYGVTFLIGSPSVLKFLTRQQKLLGADLSTLRGLVTMGSPLEKNDCIEFMNVLTPNIFNGYGTTESFWNTFLRPWQLPEGSGTAGCSCADDEVCVVRVFDDRRAEPYELVPQDGSEVGEVIIKCVAKSPYRYHNNEEATDARYHGGWLYTGDLASWDADGFITIVGRKDDMIISSGENIYPIQIEEVLCENPRVRECVVTSVPDALRGEAVTAYVVAADENLTANDLKEWCIHHPGISSYKYPRYYRFVSELPYTATGKKLHYKVRETAAADLKSGLLTKVRFA